MTITKVIQNQRGDTFMVMMTTLNMLLLAFFIVLNAISVPSDENKKQALGSLLGTFGILSAGMTPTASTGASMMPPSSEMTDGEATVNELLENLERFSKEHKLEKDTNVMKGKKGINIYMTSKALFEQGNAILTADAKELLGQIAMVLDEIEGKVNIVGHTERESYLAGPYPDNWTLSWARAASATNEILKDENLSPARFSISGYGSTQPFLGGGTPERDKFNDRVEVILERKRRY